MFNLTELAKALQINGLNQNSSLDSVTSLLKQLGYTEEEKTHAIELLKGRGWLLPADVVSAVPAVSAVSADVVSNVSQNPSVASSPNEKVADKPVDKLVDKPAGNLNEIVSSPIVVEAPNSNPIIPNPVSVPNPVFTPQSFNVNAYNAAPAVSASSLNNSENIPDNYKITPNNKPVSKSKSYFYLIIILLILILLGGTAYAYVQKIWPFKLGAYTESNISSNLLAKISQIETVNNEFSGALNIVERDPDATPFVLKLSNEQEIKKKYFYDSKRVENISRLISILNSDVGFYSGYTSSSVANKNAEKKYKISLAEAVNASKSYYAKNISIKDPETEEEYFYQVTEDGKDFNLTVVFSTDEAIRKIKTDDRYVSTTTIIEGKKVTFTKNSGNLYLNFSSEPPKPLIVTLGDMMAFMPNDVNAKISAGFTSDVKKENSAEWKFDFNAEGSFGDLNYKVNAEALRKNSNYYIKINNIPSLFLFNSLSELKGKWIVISSSATSSTSTDSSILSFAQHSINKGESELKEKRDSYIKFIKKIASIADEEKVLIFKSSPKIESVEGQRLTKYELTVKKESVITFFTRVQNEMMNDPDLREYVKDIDQGYIDYLKSEEFNQVFDYIEKNNRFTLWVDSNGYPAIFENVIRIVPPEQAEQLKDKQVNLTFKVKLFDINKPVDIQVPANAVSFEEFSKREESQNSYSTLGKQAMIQSSLSNLRPQAELEYDKTKDSYGKKPFSLGPCRAEPDTLFESAKFVETLNTVTKNNLSSATCVSSGSVGKVKTWAVSSPLDEDDTFHWCVDSTGASTKIVGSIKSDKCNL